MKDTSKHGPSRHRKSSKSDPKAEQERKAENKIHKTTQKSPVTVVSVHSPHSTPPSHRTAAHPAPRKANHASRHQHAGHARTIVVKPHSHAKKTKSKHGWLVAAACASVVLCAAVAFVVMMLLKNHQTQNQQSKLVAQQGMGPKVNVADVKLSQPTQKLTLIGETRPFATANIFARVSGFIKSMPIDRGDVVKKGQLLASIDSPETDKAYVSAQADAFTKQRKAFRVRQLLKRQLVSQEEADEIISAAQMSSARLETERVLKSYENISAPFDGIVTARFADPGALIQSATNNQSDAQILFTIAQTESLRIYMYVDQSFAADVRLGDEAEISLPDNPSVHFSEKITRISGSLDQQTRMLLTEIDFDNRSGKIVAGSFVNVTLKVNTPSVPEVPARALVSRGEKTFVPLVKDDNTIHFQEVSVGANDGDSMRIVSGLKEGDKVAINLGNDASEGQKVQPAAAPSNTPDATPGAPSGPEAKPHTTASK